MTFMIQIINFDSILWNPTIKVRSEGASGLD